MNKRYIDFVPAARSNSSSRQVVTEQPVVKKKPVSRPERESFVRAVPETVPSASGFSIKKDPKLGVIEDYNPRFVKSEVQKRPLYNETKRTVVTSSTVTSTVVEDATAIKAKRVKMGLVERSAKTGVKPVEKPVENSVNKPVKKSTSFVPPHSPFINQEKVVKRPLSKNVYQKTVEVPKEEPKGPVTIITKPEKDSKMGLLVTIILTIVLGAAAGTVAFLLLPK